MKLRNKTALMCGAAALLFSSGVQALNLNPFHHKKKMADAVATSPSANSAPVVDAAPVSPPADDSMAQYDDVGYANANDGTGITAAHSSLAVPSYAEVTNLNTGKTILVLVNGRASSGFVSLSPQALSLLGADNANHLPVRVRRVYPSPAERATLQSGQKALDRLDTPDFLLTALRRKLAGTQGSALADNGSDATADAPPPVTSKIATTASVTPKSVAAKPVAHKWTPAHASTSSPTSVKNTQSGRYIIEDEGGAAPSKPTLHSAHKTSSLPSESEADTGPVAHSAPAPAESGALYVQIAAFGTEAKAQAFATKVGGAKVVQAGQFWRVRKGPYTNEAAATSALGALQSKGYSGLKITH